MALKKCKECGQLISSSAKACPHCGKPLSVLNTSINIGCLSSIVIVVFIIIMIYNISSKMDSFRSRAAEKINETATKQESQPQIKTPTRDEQIKKYFNSWDGSHRGLTAYIKQSMNDPDSYDHVKTEYWDKGDHLVVKTTFRGKNAFGGVVLSWVMVKADLNGKILEVVSNGP